MPSTASDWRCDFRTCRKRRQAQGQDRCGPLIELAGRRSHGIEPCDPVRHHHRDLPRGLVLGVVEAHRLNACEFRDLALDQVVLGDADVALDNLALGRVLPRGEAHQNDRFAAVKLELARTLAISIGSICPDSPESCFLSPRSAAVDVAQMLADRADIDPAQLGHAPLVEP